jgi:hypothetical protein
VPRRFLYYAMAFFIGTTLLAGSIGARHARVRLKPAGSLWSKGTALPFDGSLIRSLPPPLVPNTTASSVPSPPTSASHVAENLESVGSVHRHSSLSSHSSLSRHTAVTAPKPHQDASDAWACIRARESGGNYAEDSGNGYYGAYQFSASSWRSVGGSGLPSSATPAEQDYRARLLQQRGGWQQWPASSRMCGVG